MTMVLYALCLLHSRLKDGASSCISNNVGELGDHAEHDAGVLGAGDAAADGVGNPVTVTVTVTVT